MHGSLKPTSLEYSLVTIISKSFFASLFTVNSSSQRYISRSETPSSACITLTEFILAFTNASLEGSEVTFISAFTSCAEKPAFISISNTTEYLQLGATLYMG